ncbi:MAG: hypothetical protein LBI06_05005 [Treponema sp.]|jgi:hypothetical protein|nr:hypothetical protein [Treponema sp.]
MKLVKCVFVVLMVAALVVSCASSGGGGGAARAGEGGRWTFENPDHDTGGWYLANSEFYQYRGPAKLSRDETTLGIPLLRLDVDFTQDKDSEWSEVKIANDFPKSINMRGIDKFAFDFYYNPSFRTEGLFKPKIWSNNGSKFVNETGLDLEGGEDAGEGFVKVAAEIIIPPSGGFIPDMRFSIAGYLTDYKGPVFFDNLRWE